MLVIDRECLELEDKSQNYMCKKADKYQQLHKLQKTTLWAYLCAWQISKTIPCPRTALFLAK